MTIAEEKTQLRQTIKRLKQELSFEEKARLSTSIFARVEALPQFKDAHTILAYWALPDEVQTQDFILRMQYTKRFVLPIVKGGELELREFDGIGNLQVGSSFGILEPHAGKIITPAELDMIIIPGVAFDRQGNRMGRGKGYYDKLLTNTRVYKAGVCFSIQMVPQVPVDSYDIGMDAVIVENYTHVMG